MNWNYTQPVEIIFGSGTISQLSNFVKGYKKPIIISEKFFIENGLVDEIRKSVSADVFSDVSPNPDVTEVNRCSRQIRENKNDVIIAIGGGSVIDLSKSASVTVDDITEYHGTGKQVPAEHIPIIAVPTTSGTGSEVTSASVLTNRAIGKKAPIVSNSFFPKIALVDPALTISMPAQVTASTGIDVLCHAVEGYWSKGHQPICDALAVYAARLVFENLPRAYDKPDDIEAREKMSEASVIGGLAFSLPKTTSSHACSFPITSIYHVPHGEACGLTLDFFARINGADSRTVTLAKELGFDTVGNFADAILELKKRTGLRTNLAEFNLTDDDVYELVAKSHHPNLLNNPVEITDEILYQLYNELK